MQSNARVLVALRNLRHEADIRKVLIKSGCRVRRIGSLEDFRANVQRLSFSCVFLDRDFFRDLRRHEAVRLPTYLVLLVEPKDAGHALALQERGRIHDWLTLPLDAAVTASLLARAKHFVDQAHELVAVREAAAFTLRSDAALLCSGKWAHQAEKWLAEAKSSEEPVLLAGEPGCGKRLFARLLHHLSSRAGSPFVQVSCDPVDPERIEGEIFGEDPPRRRSCLERARGGTVLFDKAERLPRRVQQRLAKAIRACCFSPVGGGEALPLEARLVFSVAEPANGAGITSALYPDLGHIFRKTAFRIPPLRERKEDFSLILRAALEKVRRDHGARPQGITDGGAQLLAKHDWPGNIRELEGVLWAASVMVGRGNISARALAPFVANGNGDLHRDEQALEEIVEERLQSLFRRFGVDHLKDLHPMVVTRIEKALIAQVLAQTRGSQVKASRVLGISRNTLRRKMDEYKIGS
ncbi:MAG: sigma 54-interacting transcriptional regulator [Pseudomonadota bacterium]